MPILGIKVGGNWNWKSGKKKRNQAAFSVIGGDIIENGEMGLIKSKEHAWHGEEFYQITGSYENCNPQYWEFKECDHHMGSVHNESRDKQKWTRLLSKEGGEAWIHLATKPVRNVLFPFNKLITRSQLRCKSRRKIGQPRRERPFPQLLRLTKEVELLQSTVTSMELQVFHRVVDQEFVRQETGIFYHSSNEPQLKK